MIKSMYETIRSMRGLSRGEVRRFAREAIDDALESAGYTRRGGGVARALPIFGAFSAGFALGTGVGVLFAPKSGLETRRDLQKRLDALVAKMKNAAKSDGASTIITDEHELRGPIGPS